MKVQLFSWYKDLPLWARGAVVVGGLGVAVYTVYSVVKAIEASANAAKSHV
jgi:hypothetical protein